MSVGGPARAFGGKSRIQNVDRAEEPRPSSPAGPEPSVRLLDVSGFSVQARNSVAGTLCAGGHSATPTRTLGATPVTQGTDGCGSVDSENAGPGVNGTKRPLCLIRRDIRRQPVLDGGAEGAGSSDPRRTRPHVCETEALTFHGRSPTCNSVKNFISSEPFAEQFPRSEKF